MSRAESKGKGFTALRIVGYVLLTLGSISLAFTVLNPLNWIILLFAPQTLGVIYLPPLALIFGGVVFVAVSK